MVENNFNNVLARDRSPIAPVANVIHDRNFFGRKSVINPSNPAIHAIG